MKLHLVSFLITFFIISAISRAEDAGVISSSSSVYQRTTTIDNATKINTEYSPNNDVSEILVTTIVQLLKDFDSSLIEWMKNLIDLLNSVLMRKTIEKANHWVAFGSLRYYTGAHENEYTNLSVVPKIHCEFSDHLKIRMPLRRKSVTFEGDIFVTNKSNNSTTQGFYGLIFEDVRVYLTIKPNSTIGNDFPDNKTEIDVTYENFRMILSIKPDIERIATTAVADLIDDFKSLLKELQNAEIHNKIVDKKLPLFSSLFTTCMNPKDSISRINKTFLSQEQDHYYAINEKDVKIDGRRISLNVNSIKIKGLSNLKFANVTTSDGYNIYAYDDYITRKPHETNRNDDRSKNIRHLVTIGIDDLVGQADWKYSLPNGLIQTEFTPWRFKINHIFIETTMTNEKITQINVQAISTTALNQSNDSFTSLGMAVLQENIQTIIESSIKNSILQAYQKLGYPVDNNLLH